MTIRRIALGLVAMVAGWVLVLVVVGLVSDAAPAHVVLFPGQGFLAELPDGVAVVDRSPLSVSLRSDPPGPTGPLYRAGALIVLPAGLPGCLPLPQAMRPR
ncbi:hypothetical protein [Maritimibacter sp. DP1N21-5]|uniref:hypothetical protein n=1 Tax=Maritimibacter sp. DP1N21-5 TaxID=2836867 RepID=UPI001C497365|nr:hypothetical protein [Maritimibacter sp. DP1N21-5]MBV7407972.1 hypothetical protein [Maritimibacter sp. DP1N21-5]